MLWCAGRTAHKEGELGLEPALRDALCTLSMYLSPAKGLSEYRGAGLVALLEKEV